MLGRRHTHTLPSFTTRRFFSVAATTSSVSPISASPTAAPVDNLSNQSTKKKRRIFTRRNFLRLGLLALGVGPPLALYRATDPDEQTPYQYGKWKAAYASLTDDTCTLCRLYGSATPDHQQAFACQLYRADSHDTRDRCSVSPGFLQHIAEGFINNQQKWIERPEVALAHLLLIGNASNIRVEYYPHNERALVAVIEDDRQRICTSIEFMVLGRESLLNGKQVETSDANSTEEPQPFGVITIATQVVGRSDLLSRLRFKILNRFGPALATSAVQHALRQEPIWHKLSL